MRRLVTLLILILLCVGAYLLWRHYTASEKKPDKSHSVTVRAASISKGNIDVFLNGLGNITPRNTVTVHTQIDGQLMQVLFTEGQFVKEGALLAQIDDRPLVAALEEAEGQMIRDQALLKEARLDLERYQTLFKQDSIAKQQLDTQAALVTQYEGTVKNDQGLIDDAKVQIVYAHITSPVSGQVGLRQVDPGNIIHTTDTNGIVVVTQLQPITAIFTLPEDNLPELMEYTHNGATLAAEAWDRDNKNLIAKGTLIAIDNEVDPTTGTVKLRTEFPNLDNALYPSQFVNIRLKLHTKENVLLMPTAAIQRGSIGLFAYKVQPDNTVTAAPVTLGVTQGDTVEVEKGLAEGDKVIIDGADGLREGAAVTIADPAVDATAAIKRTDSEAAGQVPEKKHHHGKKQSSDSE